MTDASAEGALSDRVVAYDEDWFIALHAPYFDNVNYDSKDLYLAHSLAPGEGRRFEGWLQVGASGDLAPVVRAEIEREEAPAGRLSGTVATASGEDVPGAVVVVQAQGAPYAWTIAEDGAYEIDLPVGDYAVYATAEGYSQSAPEPIGVSEGASASASFDDLQAPGTVRFAVSDAEGGAPLDARIRITEGQAPAGGVPRPDGPSSPTLDEPGAAELRVAPGDYVFTVAHGEGVLGAGEAVPVTVEPGGLAGARRGARAGREAHRAGLVRRRHAPPRRPARRA